jgi:hypothetical protein
MLDRAPHLLTIALWMMSAGCLTVGTLFTTGHWTIVWTQWGLFYSAAAAASTVWVIMARTNRAISRQNAQDTATAVGVAVAKVLNERDELVR